MVIFPKEHLEKQNCDEPTGNCYCATILMLRRTGSRAPNAECMYYDSREMSSFLIIYRRFLSALSPSHVPTTVLNSEFSAALSRHDVQLVRCRTQFCTSVALPERSVAAIHADHATTRILSFFPSGERTGSGSSGSRRL